MTTVDATFDAPDGRRRTVGELLREWRQRRRLSQLDLALEAGISARHVSLVETGKSRPSADMVLRLARHLDVPLRYRNRLLMAAGFAPRFDERPLDGPDMTAAREVILQVLRAHEPYPAMVIDRRWNIVMMNDAVGPFFDDVDPALLEPPINMLRVGLHPRGLAPRVVNLGEVRSVMLGRVARQVADKGDPEVAALYEELLSYGEPPVEPQDDLVSRSISEIATPIVLRHRDHEIRLFATITTFGTPRDITLDEIAVEAYYPADAATAELMRQRAADGRSTPTRYG